MATEEECSRAVGGELGLGEERGQEDRGRGRAQREEEGGRERRGEGRGWGGSLAAHLRAA